ncbi:hypothetical protein Ddye_018350 [Dipteronia dyeriana]|uniref:AATF leucine zipper-containing domain-containing protein n=1 Tax=Dipteronia dyeriana TaxID=168575 RepID=A0AAD9UAC6_9ROSI|nr:hypothetical protein Ddye_018350 [Dipteronia dyeriana]
MSSKQAKIGSERDSYSEDSSDMGEEVDREVDGSDEEEESGYDSDEHNGSGKDDEMQELEKEYMGLRHQEQDILKNLKRHKDEDVLTGQAVKNQKALWDKTLEFRFLLQKAFSSSNRLPQEPVRASFCFSDEGVGTAYASLIMASFLLSQAYCNSGQKSKKHSEDSKNLDVEGDDEWLQFSQMHKIVASFRDKSIDKWQRKTQVTTGAAAIKGKLHAFNQNISEQVAAYMRDPSRMSKQMQQRRSTVGVFEAVYILFI